jgi:hypothetical protein
LEQLAIYKGSWAEGLTAIATFAAVVVALFGDWIRGYFPFLQPRLVLELLPDSTKTKTRLGVEDSREVLRESVYFHARVQNKRRSIAPAHQVQVFIVRQETLDASHAFSDIMG